MVTVSLAIALFLLIGIAASKVSSFFKIPILLVFLAVGMLAGSDGIGGIPYDSFEHANTLGTIALAFILFSGGYDTRWGDVRPVFLYGTVLSTIGIFLTALFLGLFVCWFMNVPLVWGLLLGAVISSTDAAAVFALFRSKNFGLKGRLRPLLEYESGSNDPMAAFLTLFLIGMLSGKGFSWYTLLPIFCIRMAVGIGMGFLIAKATVWLFNHLKLEYEGLYYVIGIAVVLFTWSSTELLQGNGFMAVYVCGMVMGNSRFVYKYGLARFNDGLAWLMQVSIFLVLGLLVTPTLLLKYWFEGIILSFVLMLIVRPLVVWICMMGTSFSWRAKLLVAWGGFRGAAPIVFAIFPVLNEIDDANKIFHIVFFIVLTSIFIQGKTLLPLAKILHLDKVERERLRAPIEFEETGNSNERIYEYHVESGLDIAGKTLAKLQLPGGTLVLLIRRHDSFVVPNGSTIIEPGDDLLVFYDPIAFPSVGKIMTQKKITGGDT
ncbi:MAG: potassium/proton antiporter [Planctomycetia bacterium]|nr:potassium/proton antiporter [Planctomycetia bacterium]